MLGGPGIINGEITMNGLGNAVAAVEEGVRNVSQSLDGLTALVNSLKAELDQMNTRIQNIERQVTPQSVADKDLSNNKIFIQHR